MHHEYCVLAILLVQRIVQRDEFLRCNHICRLCSNADFCAAAGQQSFGHVHAVTIDKCILFRGSDLLSKSLGKESRHINAAVIEEFIADLNHHAQLVLLKADTRESCLGQLNGCTLSKPLRIAHSCRQRNMAVAAIRANNRGEATNHVILFQRMDNLLLHGIRHKVPAHAIAFLGKAFNDCRVVLTANGTVNEDVLVEGAG